MFKSIKSKLALTGGALMASGASMATDHTAAITAAQTDATGNVTAAVLAVVGVAAVIFGVGYVLRFLGR